MKNPPGGPIPVSQEAADRLEENFYQSLQETTVTHESQLRVTNEEITSLFAKELTETGRIPLSNPQIWFTSGRIYITGGVKPFGPVEFDSLIVATAVVKDGQIAVEVQEARRHAGVPPRPGDPGQVAVRRLDLHHLGAQVGQELRAIGADENRRQVDDLQAGERTGHGRCYLSGRAD